MCIPKRWLSIILLIAGGAGSCLPVFAQNAVNGLVKAEKDFAAFSWTNNTRDAFVRNLDSSAVVFDGSGPVKGLPFWVSQKVDSSKLSWWPEYAETDATGTFGYTSGGWEWRKKRADTPSAYGHYNTLWIKNGDGIWKVRLDCGTDCGKYSHVAASSIRTVERLTAPLAGFDEKRLFQLESDFMGAFAVDRIGAYTRYLSRISRLDRANQQPLAFSGDYAVCVKGLPDDISMTPLGSILSPNKELCLVYGSIVSHGKKDTYLRMWRHESGGWKIALEVLRLPI